MPASISHLSSPKGARSSSVRGLTPMALEKGVGPGNRSIRRGCQPCRAKPKAAARPVGPAPTMSTSRVFDVVIENLGTYD